MVFAITAYSGADIVAFERLEDRVGSGGVVREAQTWIERVSNWKNTTGVTTRARSLTLDIVLAETPDDGPAIGNALDDLIEATPTSAAAWQARAGFQKARGGSMENVLAAFRMSALTGSHEQYFMVQRAIFGVEYWNELPEVDRHTVVRDLLGTASWPEIAERYRRIVVRKSQAERDDIRAAVTASGLGTKDLLRALGM